VTTREITPSRPRGVLTVALVSEMTGFSPPDIALVSHTVAKGAPLQELAVFLHACRQLKLDPLLKQAYWIRRKSREQVDGKWQDVIKGALQIGIDGFRAIAESSGVYAGAEPIQYRGTTSWSYRGEELVVPDSARAIVWKIVGGHKSAFTGEAFWSEFVPAEAAASQWAKMPRLMLGKCAEAQALRKAFPAQLGSMQMADEPELEGDGFAIDELSADETEAPAAVDDDQPQLPEAEPPKRSYDDIFAPNYADDVADVPDVTQQDVLESLRTRVVALQLQCATLGITTHRLRKDAPASVLREAISALEEAIAQHQEAPPDAP